MIYSKHFKNIFTLSFIFLTPFLIERSPSFVAIATCPFLELTETALEHWFGGNSEIVEVPPNDLF